jgi:hypothetical protein
MVQKTAEKKKEAAKKKKRLMSEDKKAILLYKARAAHWERKETAFMLFVVIATDCFLLVDECDTKSCAEDYLLLSHTELLLL